MHRVFILTLGWNVEPVLGTLTRHSLHHGDHIVFLVPEFKDERSDKAILTIKEHLENLGFYVRVEVVKLPTSFKEAVLKTLDLIERYSKNKEVVINISGGMRYIILATYTAFLMCNKRNIILDELAIEGRKQNIVLALPPLIRFEPNEEERKIIEILREGEADLESIQDVLDIDKSKATLWKHLNKLVKAGIVEVRKEGRKNIYKLRARLIY
ncbi:hypothetical protein DRQ05_04520 [bacterium]|nr:MAG: hypothetical protein DRQ05_04520 [bacterium]